MIAAYNLADLRYPRGDVRVQEFFDNVDRMNALAERAPGFVWRLVEERTEARRAAQVTGATLTTLSVWETPEALGDYVFNTVHVQFYLRRKAWFTDPGRRHFVMFPVTAPDWPTEADAQARLHQYQTQGPSDDAFGWEDIDTARWKRFGQVKEPEHVQ